MWWKFWLEFIFIYDLLDLIIYLWGENIILDVGYVLLLLIDLICFFVFI